MARVVLGSVLLVAFWLGSAAAGAEEEPGEAAASEHQPAGGEPSEHGDSHAAGHGELSLGGVLTNLEFIGSTVNFALLVVILVWLGRKPLGEFLRSRRRAVKDGLDEAARIKAEAEAKYREYSERLSRLDEEVERLRTGLMEAAEKEKARIIEESAEKSRRLGEETRRLIESQMKQLQSDVMQEVVDAAVAAAEAALREKLNAQDQQRLARDYMVQITKTAKSEERA